MANGQISEAMQSLHHLTQDREILYSDRSSDDEQLLMRLFLWETKNTNVAGGCI
jgi:hypothetical protein